MNYPDGTEMVQLVVMARWPSPGRCKRRLARDLGQTLHLDHANERAMRIQRHLTDHTAAVAAEMQTSGELAVLLAVSGLAAKAAQRWGNQLGIGNVRLQGLGNLGSRLKRQLLHCRNNGQPCLVIGTDLPELNANDLRLAIEKLQSSDVVLGPAKDGGYWLIGIGAGLMQHPQCWPLSGIPWGGADVLQTTLKEAQRQLLSTELLPQRSDIDQLSDLQQWQG